MLRHVLAGSLALTFLISCNRSAPANVAATVNGRAITYAELDKQFQSQFGPPGEQKNDDQTLIQRLEVLRTLIDNEVMLQRAEEDGPDGGGRGCRREIHGVESPLYRGRIPKAVGLEEKCRWTI